MTAGSRRNGSSKFGPRNRGFVGHHTPFGQNSPAAPSATARHGAGPQTASPQTASPQTASTTTYPAYAGEHPYANHDGAAEHSAAFPATHWWYVDATPEDYAPYDDRDPYDYARNDRRGSYAGPASHDDRASSDDWASYGSFASYGGRAPYDDYAPYDDRASYDDYAVHGDDAPRREDDSDSSLHGNPAGANPNAVHDGNGDGKAGPGRRGEHYSGRHASRQGKAARKRVSKVVPAAAVAATLAAGAAVYSLTGASHPQAAQLSQSMGPVSLGDAGTVGAGHANGAASTMIKAARAAGSGAARAAAGEASRQAAAAPKATAAASPAASAVASPAQALGSPVAIENNTENNAANNGGSNAANAAPASPATVSATPSAAAPTVASPAPSASSSAPAASTLSCGQAGLLPANVTAIVSFLLANGYSDNAAAGIAGNIYQESKGNPESEGMGGGGLIGWTPLPGGFVTGNPTADLQTQLAALLTYNQGWSGYLPALNSAASPADAAYIYVTDFERAGIPAASTREQAAQDVASACGI